MTRLERAAELLRRSVAGEDVKAEMAAWLAEEEAPTQPGTTAARRRSSDKLKAVQLPDPGLDERVAEELRKGRG